MVCHVGWNSPRVGSTGLKIHCPCRFYTNAYTLYPSLVIQLGLFFRIHVLGKQHFNYSSQLLSLRIETPSRAHMKASVLQCTSTLQIVQACI